MRAACGKTPLATQSFGKERPSRPLEPLRYHPEIDVKTMTIRVLTFFTAALASAFANADSLESDIAPLLKQHCERCHGAEKAEGKLRIDRLTADFSRRENAAAWIEVRNRINLGEMPPDGEQRPPVEFIEKTSRWIAANLRAAERREPVQAGEFYCGG